LIFLKNRRGNKEYIIIVISTPIFVGALDEISSKHCPPERDVFFISPLPEAPRPKPSELSGNH
jgi:hypothetical protein